MNKQEMVQELLTALQEQRHQVYIKKLLEILPKVDKNIQESFINAFNQGIARAEELAKEHWGNYFNDKFSEYALEQIFSHPIVFEPNFMPTINNIESIIRTAVHEITCECRVPIELCKQ